MVDSVKRPRSIVEFTRSVNFDLVHYFGLLWSFSEAKLAGGLGFEPRLTESESVVLPLDDPPIGKNARQTQGELDIPILPMKAIPK